LIEKESTRAGPDSVTGLKIVATASHHVVGENFSDLLEVFSKEQYSCGRARVRQTRGQLERVGDPDGAP
jgi:hypothetical protein